ncbi:MAG: RNA polymerase sigma factor [Pseudomonadales bacterium]|nr:RNA polymerase sigma factor [Pseudomonadales bacterium]
MFGSEDELIAGMIEGNDTAFRVAISQYPVSMMYLATSLVGQKIADEVVQEAWFSALKAINKFEKRSSLKTWLLRIVGNEGKTRLRMKK